MVLTNKIITGHALEILKTLPKCSVNMCITSPPYWGLRDYKTNPVKWSDGWEGELGAEPEFNQYINHLCDIFDEVKRVLTDDGTCWVNIGDTYGGSSLNKSYCITNSKNMKNILVSIACMIIHIKQKLTSTINMRFYIFREKLIFFKKSSFY